MTGLRHHRQAPARPQPVLPAPGLLLKDVGPSCRAEAGRPDGRALTHGDHPPDPPSLGLGDLTLRRPGAVSRQHEKAQEPQSKSRKSNESEHRPKPTIHDMTHSLPPLFKNPVGRQEAALPCLGAGLTGIAAPTCAVTARGGDVGPLDFVNRPSYHLGLRFVVRQATPPKALILPAMKRIRHSVRELVWNPEEGHIEMVDHVTVDQVSNMLTREAASLPGREAPRVGGLIAPPSGYTLQ